MRICSLLPSGTEILYSLGLGDQAINPDLIITQELCEVCAVSYAEVRRAARRLPGDVPVVSLEPGSLDDILATVQIVGGLNIINRFVLNGLGVGGQGALDSVSGNNTLNLLDTLATTSAIGVNSGQLTLFGQVSLP